MLEYFIVNLNKLIARAFNEYLCLIKNRLELNKYYKV